MAEPCSWTGVLCVIQSLAHNSLAVTSFGNTTLSPPLVQIQLAGLGLVGEDLAQLGTQLGR